MGKYIDSFNCFESNDIGSFYKDFMAGKTQLQQHSKNYRIDISKIRGLVKDIVFTPQLIDELNRRKVTIPDPSKMKLVMENTKYHRKYLYDLSDNPADLGQERFSVNVTIEIPFGEEFEKDNTMISASIWIKNYGKYKELYGLSNKRMQKDSEFNYYSAGTVIQNAYSELSL